MTEINTSELKKNFHQDIIDLYKKITKMVKYKPTRLMDLINKYGGYEAAVKYITTESNVQDFAVLWESERLDLSVEALITSEKYRNLFNEEVVAHCDRKLKEYSYAPNKIEEVKAPTGYIDGEEEEKDQKIDIEEFLRQKERMMPKIVKKDFKVYKFAVDISKETWKTILLDPKIVTASNLEFLLHIYSMGDEVGPGELSKESIYSTKYPYKEVIMALGKRIKTALKVEVPVGEDHKPLWWQLLFNGGFKDNSCFEWSLKNVLREALQELIAEGKVEEVAVQTKKQLVPVVEEAVVKTEIAPSTDSKEESLSAFDRLFASIMSDAPPAKEASAPAVKSEPVVEEPTPIVKSEPVLEEPAPIAESEPVSDQSAPVTSEAQIKQACLDYYGAICDLCGFDYGYTYGEAFEGMIEVHNMKHTEGKEILPDTDPVKDLIPVCHNCHQIMHSQTPPISVEKMREIIKA